MPPITNSRVVPIQIFNVRSFLVQSSTGWVLIDAGLPGCQGKLARSFRDLGLDARSIQTILLTHGHLDHIGCLAYLKEVSGCRVVCHRSLAPLLKSGTYEEALPRVPLWKLFNGPVHKLLGRTLRPVSPEVIFEEELDLAPYGLAGRALHTPGHSPGSSSLLLDSGMCWIGDLLRETSPGRYDTGLFYQDRDLILSSLESIAAARPRIIYLSHGSTMAGSELDDFLRRSSPVK